jgi:ribosomal protein L11 methylase PrmA
MSEHLELAEEAGSFRDPSGRVFTLEGRVLRTVTARAAEDYEQLCRNGVLARLAEEGRIVDSAEVDPAILGLSDPDVRHVLEHPAIPYVSYPYEWPFPALKAAALAHLDLHLRALDADATLVDASAYNVQFKGARPIFIDVLSLRPYRDGEYWTGHRQFCEQFLNPLLLRALLGVAHNAWYRGRLEGIPTADLARLLPLRRKLSWNVLSHVVLQARLETMARRRPEASVSAVRGRTLSRTAFRGLLLQLRRWIARLEPADTGPTVWGDYAETHSYEADETESKRRFVAEFADRVRPRLAFDLGCNTGEFSALALEAGAANVIGFDFDQRALERAFARAAAKHLAFLPLFLDAADPSPDQGWRQGERQGFATRARADAVLALAFAHHLAIGRNVPLDQLLAWLTGLAPQGVIEFVPKEDPTVRQMLALRQDIFDHYSEAAFANCLARCARIVRSAEVSAHGRRLYWYERE